MIWFGTGSPKPIVYTDNATLKSRHFSVEQLLVASVASKTYTLPTPIKDLAGKPTWFVNNSTGSQTLSGAFVGGSSETILTKTMICLMVLPVSPGVYKWFAFGITSVTAGLAEIVMDYVNTMFQAGSHTGMTITYNDSLDKESIAVAYGATVTATAATSTSVVGAADTASRGDHQHGQGVHTHADTTHGGTIAAAAISDATATPTASKIPIADGAGKLAAGWGGSASTLATLNSGSKVVENPASANAASSAAVLIPLTDSAGKISAGFGGAASTLATLNSGSKVVENPANATTTPTADKIPQADGSGKLAAGWGGSALTLATLDSSTRVVQNPASASATPSAAVIIPTTDGAGKLAAGFGGAASSLATLNGSAKVVEDPANATATATLGKIPIADGAAHLDTWISTATAATPGLVEHQNWSDYVPTWTFTTGDPATQTKVGRYMHVGNMVTFYCSLESADGNDGVLTTVTLPVAPVDTNTLIPLRGHQKIDATWSDCLPFIDATTSLNIQLHTVAACTDAAACAYYISGSYEVAAT